MRTRAPARRSSACSAMSATGALGQSDGPPHPDARSSRTAAGQLPRYVYDAHAWATHVRKLADELRAGPSGAKAQAFPPAPPPPERPTAPAGVALPVEPGAGSGNGTGTTAPPVTPDAGVPTGGVLL